VRSGGAGGELEIVTAGASARVSVSALAEVGTELATSAAANSRATAMRRGVFRRLGRPRVRFMSNEDTPRTKTRAGMVGRDDFAHRRRSKRAAEVDRDACCNWARMRFRTVLIASREGGFPASIRRTMLTASDAVA
jgi:hypothetical protein